MALDLIISCSVRWQQTRWSSWAPFHKKGAML